MPREKHRLHRGLREEKILQLQVFTIGDQIFLEGPEGVHGCSPLLDNFLDRLENLGVPHLPPIVTFLVAIKNLQSITRQLPFVSYYFFTKVYIPFF